jgi:magnesium transporter
MDREIEASAPTIDVEVAKIFQDRDLISAPVVDTNGNCRPHHVDRRCYPTMPTIADEHGRSGRRDDISPGHPQRCASCSVVGINLITASRSWVISLFDATLEMSSHSPFHAIVASMGIATVDTDTGYQAWRSAKSGRPMRAG